MTKLHMIPVRQDNYIWVLETQNNQAIIVDPGESTEVIDFVEKQQLTPIAILLTHHHDDHIAGVPKLQQHYPNIDVFGPNEIPLNITKVTGKNNVAIADITFEIIEVPGHTLGHLAYYAKPYLFCGDTLFSAGCGRLFEGTAKQMFESLNKLKALPDDTIVCPAHEYTLSNLKFAHHLLASDPAIAQELQVIQDKKITLPTTIAKEKTINIFLRTDEPYLKEKFDIDTNLALFTFFRTQKDNF